MATITSDDNDRVQAESNSLIKLGSTVLHAFGSLKLTVTLFALSLVIVLVGTLAQDEMNMLEVKQRYFLSWIAPLHLDDFVPQAFYPHSKPIPGVIPFPGGALIGLLLMINLLAAKATRFHVHATGSRLYGGLAFLLLGAAVAAVVIMAGHSSEGLQGTPPISYSTLWYLVLAGVAAFGVATAVGSSRVANPTLRSLTVGVAAVSFAFVIYALVSDFRIGDPGLRIVWQLTKGLGAGLIMLVGCRMLFDRQGGNMLLHMGVALLMVGQFAFGDRQLEQRLSLIEGQSTNTLVNLDRVELAFVSVEEDRDEVTAIPGSRLRESFNAKSVITDPALPFDVKVVELYDNSQLKPLSGSNLATAGVGLEVQAVPMSRSGGTDSEMNIASAYVELIDKSTGDPVGTHLFSQLLSDRESLISDGKAEDVYDKVTAGDTSYEIGLKFHREVKPYWVHLEDVRRINYSGSETPRDYSSFIRIVDTETGEDRRERVWMNNPLRYRGETFYQSSYMALPNGKELTGIQVVRNSGWLIPYVACSIAGIGLLAHFLGTLTRFLRRRERESRAEREELAKFNVSQPSRWPVVATVIGFAMLAVIMLVPWSAVMNTMRPDQRATKFDWYTFGKIPTQFGGRVMPMDAFARQTLKAISSKESLPLDSAPTNLKERVDGRQLSAVQWLMEVASGQPELRRLPMFRIDAEEVRSELGLERRESKLYSLNEVSDQWSRASQIVEAADAKEPRDQTFKERKLVELDRRTRQFTLTAASFRMPTMQPPPKEELQELFPDMEITDDIINRVAILELQRRMESLENMNAPAIVAPTESQVSQAVNEPRWSAFAPAVFSSLGQIAAAEEGSPPDLRPGISTFESMVEAYQENDTEAFNEAVDEHLAAVQTFPIPGYDTGRVSLERWMQSNWPTGVAMMIYLACLVLGLCYFFVDLPRLRTAVWGTLAVAIAIHTLAIVCRITITGRAPVINLYSSAVFIGWAAVLFGLVIERIFRYGTGNVLAAAAGVLTLLVAYGLNSGDTMPVLRAVLDTQFWLATHVISVTLGYVATLVAGTLGIGYLIAGWVGRDDKTLKSLYRCCYGAACFGILFSFVGTVLGGLWADDSWGRFWGWDPKENGALLIVIWNALMLHARWDGMVGPRGFAKLAIGGNIVTAWSWFGTNELGIGLHSYGFTTGVLMWLSIFIVSQILVIVADAVVRLTGARFGQAA